MTKSMASGSSDGTVVIREADASDAAVLAEVGSSSFRDAYGAHSDPQDLEEHLEAKFSRRAVENELKAGKSAYLIAFVNDMPSGLVKYRKKECPGSGGDDNAIELQQLYVLAASQGYGLGRQLVEQVVAAGRHREVAGVWLQAWEFADWATGFYEQVGFLEIGKVQFQLGKTSYTDLLLWRPLE
ncbi:MAG: GNAT family N-acetyltransferase [Woeseiaceae bacterium]